MDIPIRIRVSFTKVFYTIIQHYFLYAFGKPMDTKLATL